jgi:hypothetical protein
MQKGKDEEKYHGVSHEQQVPRTELERAVHRTGAQRKGKVGEVWISLKPGAMLREMHFIH